MIAVNLLPIAYRVAAAKRRRLRLWCTGGAVYGAMLGAAWAGAALPGRAGSAVLKAKALALAAETDRAGGQATLVRAELGAAQSQVRAARRITGHPDWSVLLGLVSQAREGQIVLELFELEQVSATPGSAPAPAAGAPAPSAPAAPPAARDYILRLNGIGRQQQEVPRFVLRLEELGLFDRVSLVESQSRTLGESAVFGFRIECVLRDPGEPTP